MDKVLIIWTVFNRSTSEKCHLMTKGLEIAGVKTHSIGFSDTLEKREYLEEFFLKDTPYSFEYGTKRKLYQGGNYFTKILNNIYMSLRLFLSMLRYVIKEKVSFIIVPAQPIEVTLPTVIIGKIFRINIVTNVMEYYPAMPTYNNKKNLLNKLSWKLIVNKSNAFIVISNFLFDKIREITNKKLMILPAILPEVDDVLDVTVNGIDNNKTLLIYTSSAGYDDLLDFSLEALENIKDKDFEFVITGKYPDNEKLQWVEKISRLGLDDKVKFSGFLSDQNLMEMQRKSDALLIPLVNNDRHKARFPQKVLSYMQLGKPVITTHVGELAHYFKDGDTVVMDKSVTTKGFSEKIVTVLDDPKNSREIGLRGKKHVETYFNTEKWGNELKVFLKN